MASKAARFLPIRPFAMKWVSEVDRTAGVYVVFDLCGPIYFGRSSVDVRRRLLAHLSGNGNTVIDQAMGIASDSITFAWCPLPRADQASAEAVLIAKLGSAKFANLRKETSHEDWSDTDIIEAYNAIRNRPNAPLETG